MGKTSYSGPVYGAKGNLVSLNYAAAAIATATSTTLLSTAATFLVPGYEYWVLTELFANVSTMASSARITVKVEAPAYGGQSSYSGSPITITGTTLMANFATATVTPGEYEGFVCVPGSTIRLVSSNASAMGITSLNLHGFIRFASSTRAE